VAVALGQWLGSEAGASPDVLALEALAGLRGDLDGIGTPRRHPVRT
jgi:hypothetical protein